MFKIPQFISKFKTDLKKKAKKNLFKIYLDCDFVFYNVSFDELQAVNTIYDEDKLYDENVAGITTFLKFQKPNQKEYEFYPDIDYSKLKKNQKYAIITYKYKGMLSTKSVSTIQSMSMESIKIFEHKK